MSSTHAPAGHSGNDDKDWSVDFNPKVPRVLDVDLVHTLQQDNVVVSVSFSADGKYVATGSDKAARIYDVHSGKELHVLQHAFGDPKGHLFIRGVSFSPDAKYLATGGEDKLVRVSSPFLPLVDLSPINRRQVWDIESRSVRATFAGHEQDIYSIQFASDAKTIASASGDGTVRLWDPKTWSVFRTLTVENIVTNVGFSPDSKYVAAGSLNNNVYVWDIGTGTLVARLEGHTDSTYSVAFTPDGKDLITGSLDNTVKRWELSAPRGIPSEGPKGGRLVQSLEGHKVCRSLEV